MSAERRCRICAHGRRAASELIDDLPTDQLVDGGRSSQVVRCCAEESLPQPAAHRGTVEQAPQRAAEFDFGYDARAVVWPDKIEAKLPISNYCIHSRKLSTVSKYQVPS